MLDVRFIALLLDEYMDIPAVVRFVRTEVLRGRRPFDQDRQDQGRHRPLVVFVGASHMDGQRRSALVNQDVDFASYFSAISRILACIFAAQRSRTAATINRLPDPANMPCAAIVAEHGGQDVFEHALLRPRLEALMDNATGHAKPLPFDRLPLATCPQHEPDTVQHCPIARPRPAASRPLIARQMPLDLAPQLAWDSAVANRFGLSRFCGTLAHGVSPLWMGLRHHIYSGIRPFFQVPGIPG